MNKIGEKMSIESKLLKLFEQNPKQTYKPKQLAKILKVSEDKYQPFKRKLKKMVDDGKIFRHKKGKLGQGLKTSEVVGKIQVKTQGYGFLIIEDSKIDIFISQKNMGTALQGDTVRAVLFAHFRGKNQEAKVVEIVKRARTNIVGIFQQGKDWGVVIPDEQKIQHDFQIARENQLNAKNGQKVVAHLLAWEDERQHPQGKIVEILGDPDQPGVDIIAIARSFDLPDQFSKRVLDEADKITKPIPESEIERRLDWRNELTFTIDPEDSKDFDDAVSLKKLENGNFLLGVHIADVSFFVREGSKLDNESYNRGTSVYLVDRVIPMLPEHLSNEICSLKQKTDRLTFTVLMEMTPSAELVNYEIKESIIRSDRRFAYEEVQDIIEQKEENNKFSDTILQMFELSKKLIEKRRARGSLDFSSHEARVILDEKFKPVAIKKMERKDSHRLIEEFMVLTNSVVAKHVDLILKEKTGTQLPLPYRIHERPSVEKLKDFRRFLNALGIDFPSKKRITPKMFQGIQNSIKGTDRQFLIEEVMIRSMMKAKYSTNNEGHFGLALKYYCHFTSPIRRYPDLMVHRLLKKYLQSTKQIPIKKNELEKICSQAVEMEIRAMKAERASIKAKQLEFMIDKIGETFHGIISGVTSFGIFVEIIEFLIEGLVHITNLDDDYYTFDETRFSLTGTYQGKNYQLGDRVMVRVVLVNPQEGIIDFELVGSGE